MMKFAVWRAFRATITFQRIFSIINDFIFASKIKKLLILVVYTIITSTNIINTTINKHTIMSKIKENDSPTTAAIKLIGGKWKLCILWQLSQKKMRFGIFFYFFGACQWGGAGTPNQGFDAFERPLDATKNHSRRHLP